MLWASEKAVVILYVALAGMQLQHLQPIMLPKITHGFDCLALTPELPLATATATIYKFVGAHTLLGRTVDID
jgi:hypothetical protein